MQVPYTFRDPCSRKGLPGVKGTDNANLAACHGCVLLPETSCETENRFLDRGLLVGTPHMSELRFFPGTAFAGIVT